MADQIPISGLPNDASPLVTDTFPLVDTTDHSEAATGTTKKQTKAVFVSSMANVGITSGAINNTTLGATTPNTGAVTTLKITTSNAHGILVGEGASTVNSIVLGDNQVLVGVTSSDPVATDLSSILAPYLAIANNLSDLNNNVTAINNLQIANGYTIIVSSSTPISLVNSGGDGSSTFNIGLNIDVVNNVASNQPLVINLPIMNSTTPGSKSLQKGQSFIINNLSDTTTPPHVLQFKYQDGTSASLPSLPAGAWLQVVVTSNSTANGTFRFTLYNEAASFPVSDDNVVTYFYVPVLTITPKTVGNFPSFDTTNGSLNDSGYSASSFIPISNSYTDGQLLIGNSDTGDLDKNTLTAGTGVTITNGHGTIAIGCSSGGLAFVYTQGATQLMAVDTIYQIGADAETCTFMLPATCPGGSVFGVVGYGGTDWNYVIVPNTGNAAQQINWGSYGTTLVTGSIVSNNASQPILIQCIFDNNIFQVVDSEFYNFTIN